VTVRASTAYQKIWQLVNNFFARIIRLTVQKFQLFWVIFCIIIFFIELWHILILWLAKMPNGGMLDFKLIATGWRHWYGTGKYSFTKKALATSMPKISIIYSATLLQYQLMTVTQDRQWVRKIYLRHSSPLFNAVSSLQIASPCSKMFTDIMLVTLLLFVFTLPFLTRIIFYLPVFYHTFRSCNQVAVCQPL